MKKLITVVLLASILLIGCSNNKKNISLEDYYLELISNNMESIPMSNIKKDLNSYNYKYEFQEYTKDLSKEEIDEMDVSDMSDNIFTDEEGHELQVTVNESDKTNMMVTYKDKFKGNKRSISYSDSYSISKMLGTNIESQKELINTIGFSESLDEVLDLAFQLVDKLSGQESLTIENIESILGKGYEVLDTDCHSGDRIDYLYSFENLGTYITVETENKATKDIEIYIDLGEKSNYRVIIDANTKNLFTGEDGFYLETSIISIIPDNMIDEEKSKIEEFYKESNINLYKFIFKNENLNFYSEKYDKSDDKTIKLVEAKLDEENDECVIDFKSKKVASEEERAQYIDSPFLLNLNKGESIKIEIEMDSNETIDTPIEISLVKGINYEDVYRESIIDIGDGVFITNKVDESGEYEVCIKMGDINKYKFTLYSLSE